MDTMEKTSIENIEDQDVKRFLTSKLSMMSTQLACALVQQYDGEDYLIDAGEDGFVDEEYTDLVSKDEINEFYADNKAELLKFLNNYAVANAHKSGFSALARLDGVRGFFDAFDVEDALDDTATDSHTFIVGELINLASSTLINQYINYMDA